MKKEGLNEPEAPFVLCLGQDAWLLRTRRDVVATQYRAQAFEYLHELYALGGSNQGSQAHDHESAQADAGQRAL